MEYRQLWRYNLRLTPVSTMLIAVYGQTCPGVKVAVALLVESELWGFVTPNTVNVDDVKVATQKVQPYYAVPTRFITLQEMPYTRCVLLERCIEIMN